MQYFFDKCKKRFLAYKIFFELICQQKCFLQLVQKIMQIQLILINFIVFLLKIIDYLIKKLLSADKTCYSLTIDTTNPSISLKSCLNKLQNGPDLPYDEGKLSYFIAKKNEDNKIAWYFTIHLKFQSGSVETFEFLMGKFIKG